VGFLLGDLMIRHFRGVCIALLHVTENSAAADTSTGEGATEAGLPPRTCPSPGTSSSPPATR